MKSRLLASVLFLAILFTPLASLVIAQSNNSFQWGVAPDEEFTYVLQRSFYADDYNRAFIEAQLPFLAGLVPGEKVILRIEHLDPVETLINESEQLPRSYSSLLRSNDSEVIQSDLTGLVIPVGDWEFLTEIENITQTEGLTLINTEDEWGTLGTAIVPSSGESEIIVHVEMRYEKENGTLSYLRHRYTALGNDLIDVIFVHWYPGMPTIVEGEIQTTTLLIIAVSGAIVVVVAIIVYRGIKGKKPIIQQLGE